MRYSDKPSSVKGDYLSWWHFAIPLRQRVKIQDYNHTLLATDWVYMDAIKLL